MEKNLLIEPKDEAILAVLRTKTGDYVSGEELSRRAGVSRTAIWKEIERLRSYGYKIIAQPHTGYQLISVPDRMIPAELTWNLPVQRIGKRVYCYEKTESTMNVAHRLAASGEPEGAVIVAEAQERGRGRLGRTWISPKGKGIYASILLRPDIHLPQAPLITLMTAVAAARAVRQQTGLSPEIKWPNDLLIKGKKISGILTELNAEINRVNYVVIGIGLNVNTSAADLPAHATSLAAETGAKLSRIAMARALFTEMDLVYDAFLRGQFQSILDDWRRFAVFFGKRIKVVVEGRSIEGQAQDIDTNGALLIRTDTGFIEALPAGEVLVVR